jgi:hypothetical protein
MKHSFKIMAPSLTALFALTHFSCGGSEAQSRTAEDDEDYIEDIIGEVDEQAELQSETDDREEDAYKGSTKLTVNLRVVNSKNPRALFKLMRSDGKVIVDDGKLGKSFDVDQGVYTLEFKTPLVFNEPVYRVEEVRVAGKEMNVDESFPAGEITLDTYRGKQGSKCKSVTFSVRNETKEEDLPGKGKTCKPIILEAGSYELLLDISKNKVQPVQIKIDREQVSRASIELEK